jgi:flavorubredoxin
MTQTNHQTATSVHEVADGIGRISAPVALTGGTGFSFNQYLVVGDEPLLFHTGPRKIFSFVREAAARILPPQIIRYIAFSHVEADECRGTNAWLAVAPHSVPLCGSVAALVSINGLADRLGA